MRLNADCKIGCQQEIKHSNLDYRNTNPITNNSNPDYNNTNEKRKKEKQRSNTNTDHNNTKPTPS